MKLFKLILPFCVVFNGSCQASKNIIPDGQKVENSAVVFVKDSVAERILLYQRSNGGWPQPGGNAINYTIPISETLKNILKSEKNKLDGCIDDQVTTLEIKTLVAIFKKTNNPEYKKSAENGIKYLLSAQNLVGGWGQFYPDTSSYRKHITYNDNAMVNVLWVLKYTAEERNDFEVLDKSLIPQAKNAMIKGIDCILKTQHLQSEKLTAWCAQHDRVTLKPAIARAFELASISGSESVGICYFLMEIENPSSAIKNAINSAVSWLVSVKIIGIKVQDISDSNQPSGKDRIIVSDPNSTIWARFYDLQTNKPFFAGRDSMPKPTLAEIENERRIGYAYYGTWPKKLLATDYPLWLAKWGK